MTIYPAEIPRKVAQLSDDVLEIYKLISTVEKTQQAHSVRLDRIDGRLDGMQHSLDTLTEQMSIVVSAVGPRDD